MLCKRCGVGGRFTGCVRWPRLRGIGADCMLSDDEGSHRPGLSMSTSTSIGTGGSGACCPELRRPEFWRVGELDTDDKFWFTDWLPLDCEWLRVRFAGGDGEGVGGEISGSTISDKLSRLCDRLRVRFAGEFGGDDAVLLELFSGFFGWPPVRFATFRLGRLCRLLDCDDVSKSAKIQLITQKCCNSHDEWETVDDIRSIYLKCLSMSQFFQYFEIFHFQPSLLFGVSIFLCFDWCMCHKNEYDANNSSHVLATSLAIQGCWADVKELSYFGNMHIALPLLEPVRYAPISYVEMINNNELYMNVEALNGESKTNFQ